jgi:U3 small nucleolar RNA-associated protein 14
MINTNSTSSTTSTTSATNTNSTSSTTCTTSTNNITSDQLVDVGCVGDSVGEERCRVHKVYDGGVDEERKHNGD